MLEIFGLFLDNLYKASKICNEFCCYELAKEWYENNGYVVIFEKGHHIVFHKENN